MTEHTPGPWKNEGGVVCGRHVGIDGRDMGPSFDIFDAGNAPHESVEDEWDANARLIAASPDVLVASKAGLALLEQLERKHLVSLLVGIDSKDFKMVVANLRAVIAKATEAS